MSSLGVAVASPLTNCQPKRVRRQRSRDVRLFNATVEASPFLQDDAYGFMDVVINHELRAWKGVRSVALFGLLRARTEDHHHHALFAWPRACKICKALSRGGSTKESL